MIRAYRMLADSVPYPLHLGVTEAGTVFSGSIKSSVGIGTLLAQGIGDTIRVSLAADPVEEPKVAFEILKALGLRERGPVMIACPSCGRDNVGVHTLAEEVEARLAEYPEAFEVAVLGCAVNGPGESGDADFGIAGGRDVGFIYAHGRVLQEGDERHPRRRALPRDRPVDRRRDVPPEAAEDGEAGGARDGGSLRDPARVVGSLVGNMIARASQLFLPTLRDAPADAEAVEPQAARPRRLHPPGERGPLDVHAARLACPPEGRADHSRGDGCDRRAGDAHAGADPARAVGGDGPDNLADIFHVKDRADRQFILPMTHEETVTFHAARSRATRSCRSSGTTSRPSIATSRGRGAASSALREFIMKDAYSFDRDEEGVRRSFEANREAYKKIFARFELETYDVQAESGAMGGKFSVDFLAPSGSGENTLVVCENGDYAADIEVARAIPATRFPEPLGAPQEIETPGVTTIEGLARVPRDRRDGHVEGDAGGEGRRHAWSLRSSAATTA